MIKLPTQGSTSSNNEKDNKHIQKMKKMVHDKQDKLIAKSTNSLVVSSVSLGKKISHALKKHDESSGRKKVGAAAGIKDIKKKYGWTMKRTLKLFGVFGVVMLIGLVLLSGVGVAFAIDAYQKAPVINQTTLQAKQSSIVYYNDGTTELFRLYGTQNRKNVDLAQIPQGMQYAMIALEEKDFYKQDLPWLSILRALQDCTVGKLTGNSNNCAGASGLAQQLYRNVTGDNLSNIQRKIRELFAAKKLLDTNSKDEILELYLNWVPFGKNVAGVQVASQTYFGKDIKDVTLPQACMIASMPQNPPAYENGIYARAEPENRNYKSWEALVDRKNTCLNNLATYDIKGDGKKLIETKEQLTALQAEDLGLVPRKDARQYPHFQEFVEKELSKIFPDEKELTEGGWKITTTLDKTIQIKLDAAYDSQDNKDILASAPVNNAASVILDGPTGSIVGMRGSMDYNNTDIDGQVNIVDSGQAPGSSMKPYVYISAFEQGFNPSTVLLDAKTDFGGGYSPSNDAGGPLGAVTIRYALQNSVNISAVRGVYLSQGGGDGPDGTLAISKVIENAEKMGLRFPEQSNECKVYVTTGLGACDINMLSHATAYNTMAQDGNLRTATPFVSITREPRKTKTEEEKQVALQETEADNKRIADKLGEVYPKKDAVINPLTARVMQQVMSDSDMRADGFGSTRQYLIFDGWKGKVAAKTGTATGGDNNEATDLWTAGYTKKYTVVSWAGNTRNELIKGAGNTFSVYHVAPTWQTVMTFLHEGMNPELPENNFSTEGLLQFNAQCPGGTRGGSRCSNEWMTPTQVEVLKNFQAASAKPDYNPYEKSIFENRNELFVLKRYVSKLDRKLVDPAKFPAEYVEQVDCTIVPSEFPKAPNWRGPADSYASRLENKCNERSTIDPNAIGVDLSVSPSLGNNQLLVNPITITAKGRVDNQSIKRIEVKIDGAIVDAADGATLVLNPATLNLAGKKFMVIRVVDNFDKGYEFNYSDIEFQALPEFTSSDYSSINGNPCTPNSGGLYDCVFNLPSGKKWSQGNTLKATIGTNTTGSTCTYIIVDRKFVCNNVPFGVTSPLRFKLKSPSDGSFVPTSATVGP
jgi:membrane peptidoglycan carboxypeptidase